MHFPLVLTHLSQPCDNFTIQKIEPCLSKHWETYKMEIIKQGMRRGKSGRFYNSEKEYFLKLVALCIWQVSLRRDKEGITYARKAMILTGMALNFDGLREVKQLTPKLQTGFARYRAVLGVSTGTTLSQELHAFLIWKSRPIKLYPCKWHYFGRIVLMCVTLFRFHLYVLKSKKVMFAILVPILVSKGWLTK